MEDSSAETATTAPIVEKNEPAPAPFSRLLNDDEVDQSTQGKKTKDKKSITQFVENSFATFDRRFLPFGGKKKNSEIDKDGKEEENDDGKPKKTKEEQEEDDAYATFTYLAILTALYLPFLLFLWIRRNVFGTASLVRSLFLGHMLRFGVAFMLLPPSTARSFVPKRVWNVGVKIAARLERLWKDKRVQAFIPTWVHFCLTLILGVQTDPLHTSSSSSSSNNSHSGAISMGMSGGILNVGGGALGSGNSGYNVYSGSSGSGSGGGNNGVWPPPALMGLAIFTVLAFVVHPDGPTWIMLGKMRDGIHSFITNSIEYIQMVRNGTITLTPSELSGTLASIIILVTIVNHIRTNRNAGKTEKDREKERELKRDHKHHKSKHKKGKRGKGGGHGSQGGGNNAGKGRIRGGHYRASKEIYHDDDVAATITNSATLLKSRSRSSSPSPIVTQERHRCLSDMEESAVSSATSDNTLTHNSQSHVQPQPLPSVVEKKQSTTANSHVHVNLPSSTSATPSPTSTSTSNSTIPAGKGSAKGTSTPECLEDDKSISSFATAHTNHTSGSGGGGRRKNNRNRRAKRNAKQNNVSNTNVNLAPVSSTSTSSPTSPSSRGTNTKSDRSKQGKFGSKSLSSSPSSTSKKMEAFSNSNSAVDKRTNYKSRQTSHSQQEQRRVTTVSATSNNANRDVSLSKANGGNNVSVFTNTRVSPSSSKESSLEQNRERSFTAPNRPSSIAGVRAGTGDIRHNDDNSFFQKKVETMVKIDSAPKVQALEHESLSPIRMEAFVPVTDLESKMISESLLNSHREREVEKSNDFFHQNSNINLNAAVTARPSPEPLLNYTHSSLYSSNGDTITGNEYRPEKMELATFLSRVGLIGSICSNLLADLAGVSSLLLMTDADYDRYGIGPAKRFEIRHLLQTRNMRQQSLAERSQKTIGWNDNTNTAIRPPPGLRALAQDPSSTVIGGQRGVSLGVNCANPPQASMQLFSSNTAATSTSSNYSFSTGSSFNSLSMPPGMPQCNEDQVHCVKKAVDSSPRNNMSLLPISPLGHTIVPLGNGMNGGHFYAPKMINDEEIEADLQELGGQMAGSILDF